MQPQVHARLTFLDNHGVPFKMIDDAGGRTVWRPLAPALRACRYAQPPGADDPLTFVTTKEMLISGKLVTAVDLSDFLRILAICCKEAVAPVVGLGSLNDFIAKKHQTSHLPDDAIVHLDAVAEREAIINFSHDIEPGLGNMLAEEDAHFDRVDSRLRLVGNLPEPDDAHATIRSFLRIFPEWQDDAKFEEEGNFGGSPQMTDAFTKWLTRQWPWKANQQTAVSRCTCSTTW